MTVSKALDKLEQEASENKQVKDKSLLEIFIEERGYDPYAPSIKPILPIKKKPFINTSGKGYKKYSFTLKDISRITHRKISTIRKDISLRNLDLENIEDFIKYIKEYTV